MLCKSCEFSVLHFNARSICNKFSEVEAEIKVSGARVICITETWLKSASFKGQYCIEGYDAFFNNRNIKTGGGAMIFVDNSLPALQLTPEVTSKDAFNIYAISFGHQRTKTVIAVVYRAPRANYCDTKAMFSQLDAILTRSSDQIIVVGDFNVPHMDWHTGTLASDTPVESLIRQFACEHSLTQLAQQPTRGSALLDLVFISSRLSVSFIDELSPVAGSDHNAQLLSMRATLSSVGKATREFVDYQHLSSLLSHNMWNKVFASFITTDDYADSFTAALLSAIKAFTSCKPVYKREALPKHIVQLIRLKKRLWLQDGITGDYTAFMQARLNFQAAIRHFRRSQEQQLAYRNNRKKFFSYVIKNVVTKRDL